MSFGEYLLQFDSFIQKSIVNSCSAYVATSTESNGVKIDGFLYPNSMQSYQSIYLAFRESGQLATCFKDKASFFKNVSNFCNVIWKFEVLGEKS